MSWRPCWGVGAPRSRLRSPASRPVQRLSKLQQLVMLTIPTTRARSNDRRTRARSATTAWNPRPVSAFTHLLVTQQRSLRTRRMGVSRSGEDGSGEDGSGVLLTSSRDAEWRATPFAEASKCVKGPQAGRYCPNRERGRSEFRYLRRVRALHRESQSADADLSASTSSTVAVRVNEGTSGSSRWI